VRTEILKNYINTKLYYCNSLFVLESRVVSLARDAVRDNTADVPGLVIGDGHPASGVVVGAYTGIVTAADDF
jgi:hypothetical protein